MYFTVDLCVLCLTSSETRNSILAQDDEGIIIEEKCRFILNENVHIRPEVSYVCLNCLKILNYVYYFKHMCLQNIKTFNNYVDTLKTKKHLKVALTGLQYQKKIELMCNNESTNEISSPIEVVPVKNEVADNCVLQDGNLLKKEEAMDENDEFSTLEKPENTNDNMHYSSSLNNENHIIENFLNRVKKETEFNLIAEEIQIKDEILFEPTDSDSEDILNIKLLNEGKNKPDNFSDKLDSLVDSEHSTADDDKKTSKNCNLTLSEGSRNRRMNQNVNSEHTEERPFKCTTCKKTFLQPHELILHKRTHTGEKPYECDVCRETFNQIDYLRMHKRIHISKRSFKCSECHKTFSKSGNLSLHKRIHTGEKPFHCKICQYKCAQNYDLKKHMRMHTGEKPFHCNICQYKCARNSDLKKHVRTHTGEKPLKCKYCQKAFGRDLKRHIRTQHTDKI